jgi:peptidyl-prolyl cis-trans isomerase B (cyclophilin B)
MRFKIDCQRTSRTLKGTLHRTLKGTLHSTLSILLSTFSAIALAQGPAPEPKKANERPATSAPVVKEPFDGASVELMTSQCVTFDTEVGLIEIEVLPEGAPESVRNFLNLAATGLFDTTTFGRVVPKFVIQGGNLGTNERWSYEMARRAARRVPDEPSYLKHVRGIVSMARPDEPNMATTHFFILVNDAPTLDGIFAAFGRVRKGMEVVDAINQAPVDGEKPQKPVKIRKAIVAVCKR